MTEIPFARPSSTVVLVRPGAGEPEIFMARRHEKSSFGAAYAFPGGVVDPEDKAVHEFCTGMSTFDADANLGVKGEGLDYYSAGIRELFEETGVLLANIDRVGEPLRAARDALNDGSDNWADFVTRHELMLRCDALHYISHWVTPPSEDKRYTTRFFLAALPEGQEATHCGGELTESCWRTAQAFLAAGRAGELVLHHPTGQDTREHCAAQDFCRTPRMGTRMRGLGRDYVVAHGRVSRWAQGDRHAWRARLPGIRRVTYFGPRLEPYVELRPGIRRLVAPNPSMMTGARHEYLPRRAKRMSPLSTRVPAIESHIEKHHSVRGR